MTTALDRCGKCGTDLAAVAAAGLVGHVCRTEPSGVVAPGELLPPYNEHPHWDGDDEDTWCQVDEAAPRAFLGHVFARAGVPSDVHVPKETPLRMAKALAELLSGYGADLGALLKTFELEGDPGVVAVKDLPFASLCEHHVLPFTGTASIAYLPVDRIVGLSKLPRLLRAITRRLQVQERVGQQVAEALMTHVGASGAMVVIRGRHTCMSCRGVESTGEMVTSCVRGVFRDDPAARAEVLSLIG